MMNKMFMCIFSAELTTVWDQYYKPNLAIIQLPYKMAIFDALFYALNGLVSEICTIKMKVS